MKLSGLLMTTAIIAMTASAAHATKDRGWYVGIEGGASWVSDTDFSFNTVPALQNDSVDFDTGWTVLGTVGYAWSHGWRLEFELGYRDNDHDGLTINGVPVAGGGIVTTQFEEFSQMVNLHYDFRLADEWTLSLGVGVGGDHIEYSLNGLSDEDYVFAYQAIVGLNYEINDRMDLFLNYRYFNAAEPEFNQVVAGVLRQDVYDDVEKHAVTVGLRFDLYPEEAPAPEPQPQPQPQPTPPPKQFIVFFGFNKSNLTAEAQRVIAEAASAAKQFGAASILVTGHTDTVGSHKYNMKLSIRRANNVRSELARNGIASGMITTVGRGETELLVQTGDGVKEPQNRRATIDLNM